MEPHLLVIVLVNIYAAQAVLSRQQLLLNKSYFIENVKGEGGKNAYFYRLRN